MFVAKSDSSNSAGGNSHSHRASARCSKTPVVWGTVSTIFGCRLQVKSFACNRLTLSRRRETVKTVDQYSPLHVTGLKHRCEREAPFRAAFNVTSS